MLTGYVTEINQVLGRTDRYTEGVLISTDLVVYDLTYIKDVFTMKSARAIDFEQEPKNMQKSVCWIFAILQHDLKLEYDFLNKSWAETYCEQSNVFAGCDQTEVKLSCSFI